MAEGEFGVGQGDLRGVALLQEPGHLSLDFRDDRKVRQRRVFPAAQCSGKAFLGPPRITLRQRPLPLGVETTEQVQVKLSISGVDPVCIRERDQAFPVRTRPEGRAGPVCVRAKGSLRALGQPAAFPQRVNQRPPGAGTARTQQEQRQ